MVGGAALQRDKGASHLASALVAAGVLLNAVPADAAATSQRRDQKGHFVACAKPAAANGQRCGSSAGKFVKCPPSGVAAMSRSAVKN